MSGRRWVFLGLIWFAACGEANELSLSTPDRAEFASAVYPVLLRDCAFHACHGSTERYLQVFGPGRGRMLPTTRPLDPVSDAEIAHAYDRARSMIDAYAPAQSWLLLKPLEVGAGGSGHEGADDLGRNVYQTVSDPNYLVLSHWVLGRGASHP
jgi:hypothetical protein